MCARTDLLLFPRGFSASALLHRIGERDRIFKCGAMIACAPTPVRPPSGFGQAAKSVTILNSNYSSRNLQRAIKMEGKKGKERERERGREGEPRQAMHVVARARPAGQEREMENHFQWKYCCVEVRWQQFGIRLLIMAFSYFEFEPLNAQGHH